MAMSNAIGTSKKALTGAASTVPPTVTYAVSAPGTAAGIIRGNAPSFDLSR